MIRTSTLPAIINANPKFVMLALAFTTGFSGCSQATQWLTQNQLHAPTALADASQHMSKASPLDFDTSEDVAQKQQPNFVRTSFKKVVTTTAGKLSANTPAQTMDPNSPNVNSATMTTSLHLPTLQQPKTTTPQKTLTTLARGENLDAKLKNAPGIVILDFYADWCGPCRQQGTILHAMESKATQHKATIIKVNIEQHRQLAQKYKVSSLPTLIAIKEGTEVRRQIGLANQSKLSSLMQL